MGKALYVCQVGSDLEMPLKRCDYGEKWEAKQLRNLLNFGLSLAACQSVIPFHFLSLPSLLTVSPNWIHAVVMNHESLL